MPPRPANLIGTTAGKAVRPTPDPPSSEGKVERAPVGLVGYLASTSITVGDLARLNVGDILKTDKPAGETLLLTVGGRPKYRGRVGQHRGKKALLITDRATPRDQP